MSNTFHLLTIANFNEASIRREQERIRAFNKWERKFPEPLTRQSNSAIKIDQFLYFKRSFYFQERSQVFKERCAKILMGERPGVSFS